MVSIFKFRKSIILLGVLFTKIALGNHSPSKNELATHRIATWGSEFVVASDWPVLVLGKQKIRVYLIQPSYIKTRIWVQNYQ